ncbi:hypothetical protein HYR65_02690, partial [Candidatus Azambacteria bacterium]|nr:hypothetical protein [Candidatus Azambacteria bacterium]
MGEEKKMIFILWILVMVGTLLIVAGGLNKREKRIPLSVVLPIIFGFMIVFVTAVMLQSFSIDLLRNSGEPLTTIKSGVYTIVGYVEVSKDKQEYYQMILEQKGKVKLYTLPKDMIIHDTSSHRTGLEVIEKARLKKRFSTNCRHPRHLESEGFQKIKGRCSANAEHRPFCFQYIILFCSKPSRMLQGFFF